MRWLGAVLLVGCASSHPAGSSTRSSTDEAETMLEFTATIAASPEQVFEALTTPEQTQRYFFETLVESELEVDRPYRHRSSSGALVIDGRVEEIRRPDYLRFTFRFPEYEDAPTIATYSIQREGDRSRITVRHSGFAGETATFRRVREGWPVVLRGLEGLF